jgi:PAS domain S-box-containing protein
MAKKSASSAAEKDEMIRVLFENSRDLMHVVSPVGFHKLINPAWTRLLGWTEEEVVGQRAIDFTHPEERAGVVERLMALPDGGVTERQMRLRAKDGQYHWFSARTQRMPNGDFIASLRDASEERASAEELEETRRTRRQLSQAAGIGAWTFEPQDGRIEWSQDLLNLTGRTTSPTADSSTPASIRPTARRPRRRWARR